MKSVYFANIDECVPLSIASTSTFLSSYQQINYCTGGVVNSTASLEALRFCNVVRGDLTITLSSSTADFSSVFDISTIGGMSM